jgi:hypothetical protein
VLRLVRAGVQQLVVPDSWAADAADIMVVEEAPLGLVLPDTDWLEGRWALANLPTAAILPEDPPDLDRWMLRVSSFSQAFPKQRLILIADSSIRVGGRRLDQVASPLGSYPEAFLDALANEIAS